MAKKALTYTAGGVIVLVGLYALAGFVVAPKIIGSKLQEAAAKAVPGSTLTYESIRLNPFTLKFGIDKLQFKGVIKNINTDISFLSLNAGVKSFSSNSVTIDNVDLATPKILFVGNFEKLGVGKKVSNPQKAATKKATASASSFHWAVNSMSLTNGLISLTDTGLKGNPSLDVKAINTKIKDLSDTGTGTFEFSAKPFNAMTTAKGTVQVFPLKVTINPDLKGLKLATFNPWFDYHSAVTFNKGELNGNTNVAFDTSKRVPLTFACNAALTDFSINKNTLPVLAGKEISLKGLNVAKLEPLSMSCDQLKIKLMEQKKAEQVKKVTSVLGFLSKQLGKVTSAVTDTVDTLTEVSMENVKYNNGTFTLNSKNPISVAQKKMISTLTQLFKK